MHQLLIFAKDAANPPPDGFFNIPTNGFFCKLVDNADVFAGAATVAGSSFFGASFLAAGLLNVGFAATAGFAGKLDFYIGLFFRIEVFFTAPSSDSSLLPAGPSYEASAVSASFLLFTAITGFLSTSISSSSSAPFFSGVTIFFTAAVTVFLRLPPIFRPLIAGFASSVVAVD